MSADGRSLPVDDEVFLSTQIHEQDGRAATRAARCSVDSPQHIAVAAIARCVGERHNERRRSRNMVSYWAGHISAHNAAVICNDAVWMVSMAWMDFRPALAGCDPQSALLELPSGARRNRVDYGACRDRR